MRQWVKEAGLPPNLEAQVADFLEELGVVNLKDLTGLDDYYVAELLKLVPPLKKKEFKERIAIHRPVSFHSFTIDE